MKKLFFCIIMFLGLVVAGVVCASSGGGHEGSFSRAFIYSVINFILFLILLYVLALPRVKGFFIERSQKIRQALKEAEKSKDLAEKKLKEYEEKLRALDKEVQDIKEAVKKEGEAEKEKIIAEAAREAGSIKKQAELVAEHETRKAKAEIQRELARLSLEGAEQLIRDQINKDDQVRLVKDYINDITR